jgi:uncharacterized protein HemX
MSYDPSERARRDDWTPGRFLAILAMLALGLSSLLFVVWQRQRVAQARVLAEMRLADAERARAEQALVAAQAAAARDPTTAPAPGTAQSEVEALRDEVESLHRRVAELEARVPAFPNPEPARDVGSGGGLTPPAKPD